MYNLWLFLKGVAMGAADVVPGVSGGTIAFVTGIYDQLLGSIRRVDAEALRLLFREGPKAAWTHINGNFLVILGSGILTALLTLANGIHYLLQNYPEWLWAFFFGLIVASTVHVGREIRQRDLPTLLMLLVGIGLAAWVSVATPTSIEPTPLVVFAAGSVAICAMILPGISGSFILLLMGLYEPILGALRNLDLLIMATFASGAAIGLMAFSRVLSWMLEHQRNTTFSLLTGFMIGSLVKVWPWKVTLESRLNSHGELVPVVQDNILPTLSADVGLAVALMVAGVVLVLGLEWVASRLDSKTGA